MSAAKVKLCVVSPHQSRAYVGGAEQQINYLIETLARLDRYEIYYLARHTDDVTEGDGYTVVPVGRKNRTLRLGYCIDAPSLYRALKRIRPDVIYQRVACGYTGVCALFARRSGARLVWHVSSESDVDGSGALLTGNPVARLLEQRSVEYAIQHAETVVVQTQAQARLLLRNYGRRSTLVSNFHPAPKEQIDKSGPLTVVWIANLKPVKRPEMFLRVAAGLRDLGDVRFVMIGARLPGGRAWSRALMRAIEATPNLEYLGWKNEGCVNDLLARSHLLVNTSEKEGFPNTFIQAWLRQVPVVSVINPDGVLSREGIGIAADTEDELVEAVRLLLTDQSKRRGLATRALQYALEHHSFRNIGLLRQVFENGWERGRAELARDLADTRVS